MRIDQLSNVNITKDESYKNFLWDCYKYASKSKHPSTHTSALLVKNKKIILRGRNDFPIGVRFTKERIFGKNKHIYLNHAERDLIYKSSKNGIKTNGLTIVMPWLPCLQCANAIISSGIKKLIVHKQMIERTRKEWQKELIEASKIMKEAGIKIIAYDGIVGAKAYMHGQKWNA